MAFKDHAKAVKESVVRAVKRYRRDDPINLGGTTAYFVIFAVAPILIIITSVLGLVIDEQTASAKIFAELNSLVGEEGGQFVRTLVQNFQESERNVLGTIIGVVVFFVVSFAIVVLVSALIFRFLPDTKITWGVTWVGAVILDEVRRRERNRLARLAVTLTGYGKSVLIPTTLR